MMTLLRGEAQPAATGSPRLPLGRRLPCSGCSSQPCWRPAGPPAYNMSGHGVTGGMTGSAVPYVDVHSHAYEYGASELRRIMSETPLVIVIVSDDYTTSLKTLEISRSLESVSPCLGVHPWTVAELGEREALRQARQVVDLALEAGIGCIGEVGLDTKFVAESIDAQRAVFRFFLEAARDNGLRLNLHTAGTWREVYELLVRYDIGYANFHWYTGPLDLIDDIVSHGYTLSINPAVRVQRKHQAVVERAPLEAILTESDAPYNYKGVKLTPRLIPQVVAEIARIKKLDEDYVKNRIYENFRARWLQ